MSVSSNVDSFTVIETENVLKVKADKAYAKLREVKYTGDSEAIDSAFSEWNEADNTRLRFNRAISSVRDLLEPEK